MSNHWPTKPLGELLTFLTSGSRGWAGHYSESGDLFLRIQNVGRNQMLLDDVAFVTAPETAEARRTLVQTGDVLLSITADLGRTGVIPENLGRAYINQHLAILRVRNIHPQFLSAFLASPEGQKQIMGRNRHAVKAGLNFDDIRSFKIPLPPRGEQQQIAEALDKADTLRAKRRAALAKLDSLAQSLFLDRFGDPATNPKGWMKRELKDVCEAINDCPHSTPTWTSDGVICLRTSNLTKGGWNWEDTRFVSDAAYHDRSKRGYVDKGDIVLSREGTVGVAAIVQPGMKLCMGQRLVQVRTFSQILNSEYLLRHLLCVLDPVRIGQFMVGSTSQHLNVKELRALKIPLPPNKLQCEFARRMAAVEKLKASHRSSLAKLDALFASLQHRAFRGEL